MDSAGEADHAGIQKQNRRFSDRNERDQHNLELQEL